VSLLVAGHSVFHFELQLTRTKRSPGYVYLTTAEKLLFLVRPVKNIEVAVNELDDVFFKRDFNFSFGAKFGDFIEFNFNLLLEWAREVFVIDKVERIGQDKSILFFPEELLHFLSGWWQVIFGVGHALCFKLLYSLLPVVYFVFNEQILSVSSLCVAEDFCFAPVEAPHC